MSELPSWLADQVDAAREQRSNALQAHGMQSEITDPAARARILDRIEEHIDEWILAGEHTCAHLRMPAPAFLQFGSMTLLCAHCSVVHADRIARTPADRRCDICAVEVSGRRMAPLVGEWGAFMVMGGVCRTCRGVPD